MAVSTASTLFRVKITWGKIARSCSYFKAFYFSARKFWLFGIKNKIDGMWDFRQTKIEDIFLPTLKELIDRYNLRQSNSLTYISLYNRQKKIKIRKSNQFRMIKCFPKLQIRETGTKKTFGKYDIKNYDTSVKEFL